MAPRKIAKYDFGAIRTNLRHDNPYFQGDKPKTQVFKLANQKSIEMYNDFLNKQKMIEDKIEDLNEKHINEIAIRMEYENKFIVANNELIQARSELAESQNIISELHQQIEQNKENIIKEITNETAASQNSNNNPMKDFEKVYEKFSQKFNI